MSTNRSPFTSRYTRKENYQTSNYLTSFNPVSPHQQPYNTTPSQDHSAIKKQIQQKQIQDLQKKVDIILSHNHKLVAQVAQLKQRLVEADYVGSQFMQQQRMSKYQMAEQTEYAMRKMRNELDTKTKQFQSLFQEYSIYKECNQKEIIAMNDVIHQLNIANQTFKEDNIQLTLQVKKVKEEAEQQTKMAIRQIERKHLDAMNMVQKNHEEIMVNQRQEHDKMVENMCKKYEKEKNDLQQKKKMLITKLQQSHNKEINQLRQQMDMEFNQNIQRITQEGLQQCKRERQKADKYVKEFIENLGPCSDSEMDNLRHEIKLLQDSLQSRKRLINQLTSRELSRDESPSNINEAVIMRDRLKEQVQHLMSENELLKVKHAEKYEKDLKEMVKIYQDKIEVLSREIRDLSDQNDRLRHNYEDQVSYRIKHRRSAEIEISQLKNQIRKLKVEVQGVQDEFRLNIDGVREQSATFSMALMKSMVQVKEKSNFHEDQNRKLRAMYDKHQAEVARQRKQANEKVQYYKGKVDQLTQLIEAQRQDLRDKQTSLFNKLDERQQNLRQSIRQERQHLKEMMALSEQEKRKLQRDCFDSKQKCSEMQIEMKDATVEMDRLNTKIKENEEHIERLRMELQMAGVDETDKNATLANWKDHYEGIISKLEEDKRELRVIIEGQNDRIQQLIYRYKLLEEGLKKAADSLSQRSELDKKVISLGMDQNLVKNIGQLWVRRSRGQQSE